MNYFEAINEINKKDIKQIYLLYGEESFLISQIEDKIINAVLTQEERDLNLTIYNRDPSGPEFASVVENIPFIGGKNVVLIRETALFKARKGGDGDNASSGNNDSLADAFGNIPEFSHVILTTTDKIDKRRKLFKIVESSGRAIEMAPFKVNEVRGWLNGKLSEINKSMAPDAIEHLLGVISVMPQVSLGFLSNELDKLALYATGKTITLGDMTRSLSAIPEASVFAMIDALSQKRTAKALSLYNEQISSGEHPLRVLVLLARQVRLLWQAKELALSGLDGRAAAARLGVPSFIAEKMIRQSQNFSAECLKRVLVYLAEADLTLKSGKSDKVILEQIIIELCS